MGGSGGCCRDRFNRGATGALACPPPPDEVAMTVMCPTSCGLRSESDISSGRTSIRSPASVANATGGRSGPRPLTLRSRYFRCPWIAGRVTVEPCVDQAILGQPMRPRTRSGQGCSAAGGADGSGDRDLVAEEIGDRADLQIVGVDRGLGDRVGGEEHLRGLAGLLIEVDGCLGVTER